MKFISENTVIDYENGYIRKNREGIFETPFDDFDVCRDDKGNIFILCQDKENGIYLISISGQDVKSRCILKSKVTEGYEKHFNIEYVNGWLNGIYAIKHGDKTLIIHHIINSDIKPLVVESLDEETKLFSFKDYDENLYIFYKNQNPGYRKYDWKNKSWSEFNRASEEEGELLFASGDFLREPYFAFSLKKNNKISVCCMNEILLSGIGEEVKPAVISLGREVNVIFEYQGRVLKSVKEGTGSFTRPKYAYFGSVSKYELITILSDGFKAKTYGNMTQTGKYRSLLTGERPEREEIKEPEPMAEEKSTEKKLDEIIKLLGNKSEYEMLAVIMQKITELEKILEEIKYGNTSQQE